MSDGRFNERCPYCDALMLVGPPCCPALADDLAKQATERPAPPPRPKRSYVKPEQIDAFVKKLEGQK